MFNRRPWLGGWTTGRLLRTAPTPLPPLLVFADDWDRHISGCQHLVRRLLGRYEVYWVNTIGTRRPRLDRRTLRRGLEKMRQWLALPAARELPPAHLHIANPVMWPWLSSRFDRRLNQELLDRQLLPLLRSLPEPDGPVAGAALGLLLRR